MESDDDACQRRLAAAAFAHHTQGVALLDGNIDVGDGLDGANDPLKRTSPHSEHLLNAAKFQQGAHASSAFS